MRTYRSGLPLRGFVGPSWSCGRVGPFDGTPPAPEPLVGGAGVGPELDPGDGGGEPEPGPHGDGEPPTGSMHTLMSVSPPVNVPVTTNNRLPSALSAKPWGTTFA